MKLSVFKRTVGKKGETKQLRRTGKIPANLYGREKEPEAIYVNGEEIGAVLRNMKPGLLPTTVFELTGDNKKFKAIVKEIQYHVATYDVEHIDFVILSDKIPVTVNVPIQVLGMAECVGVKLGGFVRQVIRSLKVTCLPKDIPQEFTVDVRELNIAQSKRLSDISIPAGVKPVGRMNEVAVVVAKRAGA